MYPISEKFKTYLKKSGREFETKVAIDDTTVLGTSSIVEFDIEEACIDEEEFSLGAVISSRLNMKLKTNIDISSNAKVQPYIRMNGAEGYTEWLPLGVYYVDSRNVKNDVVSLACFDRLILAQKIYHSGLNYPTKMELVMNEIAVLLGVELDENLFINQDYIIEEKPDGYTIREVLSFIAISHASAVKINKEGKLVFIEFSDREIKEILTTKDYATCNITNPAKTYLRIVANYNSDIKETEIGSGEIDETLFFYNPYITETMLENIFNDLNEMSYTPIDINWRGRPDLEVGDWVKIVQRNETILKTPLLRNKFIYKGGLKETSSSPSYTAQQSEYGFGGGLKDNMKQIEKRLGVYVLTTNAKSFEVNGSSQVKMVLPISAMDDTSIEFTIVIVGQASTDSILEVEMKRDTGLFGNSYKCFVREGWNTVNILFLAKDIPQFANNIRLMLRMEKGIFTVEPQQAQFYAYGANLLASSGIPYASIEDYVDIGEIININENAFVTFTEDIKVEKATENTEMEMNIINITDSIDILMEVGE